MISESSHAGALRAFARKLALLLMFREAVRWITAWFFVWGVIVLAARIAGLLNDRWLLMGLAGAVPLAAAAGLREYRRRSAFSHVRAAYDRINECGGVVMAEETADMSDWQSRIPRPSRPVLRWQSGRTLGLLALSGVFVAVTLCLPDRLTNPAARRPLEIGKLVGELRTEVKTLKQERILEPNKADELQKQLAKLKEQSSALDPNKTWEALDHIKEGNADLAQQAAEEALSKINNLRAAETLASALEAASGAGLSKDTATQAARDVAALLKAAKLEDGLVKGEIPPELLSQLNGLNKEDMEKLLRSIQFNKNSFGRTITNLANLKLIDARLLSQCKNAGQCTNPNALAAYLCQCTNACNSFCDLAMSYGRGGIDRGRGDAPMTWKDESSAEGAKFKEEALPPSSRLSDSQVVGVSRAAPDLSGNQIVVEHGALAGARSSGGAAYSEVILPRYKQTVKRYFDRQE